MDENTIYNTVLKCFDDFIRKTGGNTDPRANGNKTRKSLMRFYEVMSKMPREKALLYMQLIIDENLSTDDAIVAAQLGQGRPVYAPGAIKLNLTE